MAVAGRQQASHAYNSALLSSLRFVLSSRLLSLPSSPFSFSFSCSLRRDIVERKRTVESVLLQYLKFVKAGYEEFVAPSMTKADLIIPRAKENRVAIDMLASDLQRRVDAQLAASPLVTTTAAASNGGAASPLALSAAPFGTSNNGSLPTFAIAAEM